MTYADEPIRKYRSKSLVRVAKTTSGEEALRFLQDRGISSLPVTEGNELLGIVSLTDLVRTGSISPPAVPSIPAKNPRTVGDIMTKSVVTIDEAEPIRAAAHVMLAKRIHRLVVTKEGVPVGILSTRDLMAAVRDAKVEQKLGTVVTREVKTVDVDASINTALDVFKESDVRGLVVVDGDWPVGAFTQLEALYGEALPDLLQAQAVERIMSYETICFDEDTPLYRVAGHAVAMGARRILAVAQRKLVGIATGFDIAGVVALAP